MPGTEGKLTVESRLREFVCDGVTRAIGAIGLGGMALIHTIDAPSHFVGGPDTWLGVMYVGLIVSSLLLAAGLIFNGHRRIWMATAGLTSTVIGGFVLSRTVGLPGDTGDIGNWGEALGIASLFVESSLVALSVARLGRKRLQTSLGDVAAIGPGHTLRETMAV